LKTVIDQMAETDPRVAGLKPEQFIDGHFFAELEKEGFIQRLGKWEWGERELGVQRLGSAARATDGSDS
jgi:hypothetical protein